jgi:hypothetical protein
MKRKLLTTAAVFAALFFVGPANATTYYFYTGGTPGNWNTGANWWSTGCGTGTNGTVPTATDHAVICPSETCNVNVATAAAYTIDVMDSAVVNIQPNMKLTLGGATNVTSCICDGGVINLQASGGQYGNLAFTTNDHNLIGDGSIIGANHGCQITLNADNQVLMNNITISGALEITESGAPSGTQFINSGMVRANQTSDTLELDVDSLDNGIHCTIGDWEVNGTSSVLLFSIGSTYLCGDFTVSDGTLDLDATVSTCGTLSFTGGAIDTAGGSFATGQTCSECYFYVDGGGARNWDDPNHWYTDSCATHTAQASVPCSRAVICAGQECDVNSGAAAETVEVYGTLNIKHDQILTLNNGSSADSEIDGTVNLEASGGQYGRLLFLENDHTLGHSGTPGSIIGADHGCQIMLGSDNLDLTSQVTISGALAIVELCALTDTRFINDHEVEADLASGTLELDVDYLDDGTCSTGDWKVSASSATLLFSVGSTQLSGDFNISNSGTLDIDSTVHTEGDLIFGTGVLDTTGGEFKANQDLGCS